MAALLFAVLVAHSSRYLQSGRPCASGAAHGHRPRLATAPLRAAGGDDLPGDDVDAMLVTELNNVINTLKARGGAAELDLSDGDLEAMRVRGEMLFADLGAEINASFANVSASLSERIAADMAEERMAALNTYNQKTAAIRREMQEGKAQVRESMRRVAEIEDSMQASAPPDAGRRGATSFAVVALLLGLYNGGVSLWRGLAFEGAAQADVVNGSLDLLGAAVAALALWRLSSSGADSDGDGRR